MLAPACPFPRLDDIPWNARRSPLEDLPQQLLACVATLGVLCRASPAFLAPHLHCLLPYLKGENGLTAAEESEICRQVCMYVCSYVCM